MFRNLLATRGELAPLVLRVCLAVVLFPHGAQKVLGWFGGHGLEATIYHFTQQMHIPLFFAICAIAAEFLGSLALFVGFLTRVAAFSVVVEMIVAVWLVHLPFGFFMNWTGKQPGEGFEYHILVIGIGIALMIKGGGWWSIDGRLGKKKEPAIII